MTVCPRCDGTYSGRELCDYCRSDKYRREITLPKGFPEVVCLCGSTRFMDAFRVTGWQLTLDGYIVLTVGVCKHAADRDGREWRQAAGEALGQDVADKLDELHKRKIDLADYVFVLNVGGYIGESTRSEIAYARERGKMVVYLEGEATEAGEKG
jgi:hypothetical protein